MFKYRKLAGGAAAVAIVAGAAVVGFAGPASAHTAGATPVVVCNNSGSATVSWTLTNDYDTAYTVANSIGTVPPNGYKVPKASSATVKEIIATPAAGKASTVDYTATWPDGFTQHVVNRAFVPDSCTGPAAVTVPQLTVQLPTCDAPGAIVGLPEGRGQNASYEGAGYRLFLSPAYDPANSVGDYTVTVQKVGPGGQDGYPYGSVTTPASGTKYPLSVAAATGYQSGDPAAACFQRPDQPEPVVVVGTWTDQHGAPSCDVDTVAQTRTTVTKPYIWDETTKSYIVNPDESTYVTVVDEQTRPKTAAEEEECAVVTPPTEEPTPPTTEPTPPVTNEPTPTPSDTPSQQPSGQPTQPATQQPAAQPSQTATPAAVAPKTTASSTPAGELAFTGATISPWLIALVCLLLSLGIAGIVIGPKLHRRR